MDSRNVKINSFYLKELSEDKLKMLEKLQSWKIIPSEPDYLCKKCGGSLSIGKRESYADGYIWVCRNDIYKSSKRMRCGNELSVRTGTFFDHSKLSMFQIVCFVYMWVKNVPTNYMMDELIISSQTAADWSSFCREVLFYAFLQKQAMVGGEGVTVEIDESKFGKSKNNVGRVIDGQWVFGGFERGTGRVFFATVEDRKAETLIPIIEKWIRPGTTIISDRWKAYDCLGEKGFQHLSVNHSIHFVDPETGAHTNSIESTWRAAKAVMNQPGRRKEHIPGNLAKYVFQKRCRNIKADPFLEFLILAGELYNPTKPQTDTLPKLGDCGPDDDE